MRFRGEFYHLKRRPEYPEMVEAAAIARLYFDSKTLCLYFDRSAGSQWVASLWIVDGECQVDLAIVLQHETLAFVEGYCCHGDFCPKVAELQWVVLESSAFSELRNDLIHELHEKAAGDLGPSGRLPSPLTVPPDVESRDGWP